MRVLFWVVMAASVVMFVVAVLLGLFEPGQNVGTRGNRTPHAAVVLLATVGATLAASFGGIALWMLPTLRQFGRVRQRSPGVDAIVAQATSRTKAVMKDLGVAARIPTYVVMEWNRLRVVLWGRRDDQPLLTIERSDLERIEVGEGWTSTRVPTMELWVHTPQTIVQLPLVPSRDGWELFPHLDPARTGDVIARIARID